MDFKIFKKKMQKHIASMIQDAENLFEVDVDKDVERRGGLVPPPPRKVICNESS